MTHNLIKDSHLGSFYKRGNRMLIFGILFRIRTGYDADYPSFLTKIKILYSDWLSFRKRKEITEIIETLFIITWERAHIPGNDEGFDSF